MKHSIQIATVVAASILLGSTSLQAADENGSANKSLPAAPYDIAGVWMGSDAAIPGVYTQPLLTTTVVTPADPSGHRFTYVAQGINGDPSFMGLFPDATQLATQVGTMVRTGPRTFRVTAVQYFVKPPKPGTGAFGSWDRGEVQYFFVSSGTVSMLNANTRQEEGTLAFYSKVDRAVVDPVFTWIFGITELHNQDRDNDGLPDPGEVPFVCFPSSAITKRLPLLAPCAPPAP
jgi:hypothetical protein